MALPFPLLRSHQVHNQSSECTSWSIRHTVEHRDTLNLSVVLSPIRTRRCVSALEFYKAQKVKLQDNISKLSQVVMETNYPQIMAESSYICQVPLAFPPFPSQQQ